MNPEDKKRLRRLEFLKNYKPIQKKEFTTKALGNKKSYTKEEIIKI